MLGRSLLRRAILTSALVIVILLWGAPVRAQAQNFTVFRAPDARTLLVSDNSGQITSIGESLNYIDGPLVAEVRGAPHVYVVGADLSVWVRTSLVGWKSLGGTCSRLKTVGGINAPTVEAYCPSVPDVKSNSSMVVNSWTVVRNPSSAVMTPTIPLFVASKFAVYLTLAKELRVVDLETLRLYKVGSSIPEVPLAEIVNGELMLFRIGVDKAVWYRTLSQEWRSLGGSADRISSLTKTPDGKDVTIVIPGADVDTVSQRTLTTAWVEVDPFANYPLNLPSLGGSSEPIGPVTSVDEYLDSFIDAWGADIVKLRSFTTPAAFESALPSLKTTLLEAKLIQLFDATTLKDVMPKLVMAFPRIKYSDGVAKAMVGYLTGLSNRKGDVRSAFGYALRSITDDPVGEQRAVILDLFSRVPGIVPDYRRYLLESLEDANLNVAKGELSEAGISYYAVMLAQSVLGTRPSLADARRAVDRAMTRNLDATQREALRRSLADYERYADENLVCGQNECALRPSLSESCSATAPCQLGLQCWGGKCSEFSGKGTACGIGKPMCHPALTCSGTLASSSRSCVERAKLGESCKEQGCQYGLVCLRRVGICVDTAKEEEACAGISNPCEDLSRLSCVGGYCRKRGARSEPCSAEAPCLSAYNCVDEVCAPKPGFGEACSPSNPCGDGMVCVSRVGVVGLPGSRCEQVVPLGGECGMQAFCDATQGHFCGSKNVCRTPGLPGEYCVADGECAAGLMCNSGSCSAAVGSGKPCERDVHCSEALYCKESFGAKACSQKGVDGAPCPCLAGHACMIDVIAGKGQCKRLSAAGEPCGRTPYAGCAEGLVCHGGGVLTPGSCRALGGSGSPCTTTGSFGPSFHPPCASGLYCSFGFCAAGAGEEGDCGRPFGKPCASGLNCQHSSGGFARCTSQCSGLYNQRCGGSDNFACRLRSSWPTTTYGCVAKLQFGQPCVSDSDQVAPPCDNSLFCSPSLKTCQFRSLGGEACSTDGSQPCGPYLNCRDGRCL